MCMLQYNSVKYIYGCVKLRCRSILLVEEKNNLVKKPDIFSVFFFFCYSDITVMGFSPDHHTYEFLPVFVILAHKV